MQPLSSKEMKSVISIQIQDKAVCVSFRTNDLAKSLNPSVSTTCHCILCQTIFLKSWLRKTSKKRKSLNSNQFYFGKKLTLCHNLFGVKGIDKSLNPECGTVYVWYINSYEIILISYPWRQSLAFLQSQISKLDGTFFIEDIQKSFEIWNKWRL